MANITIVSTTNSIQVDFGDYSSSIGVTCGSYNKAAINHISCDADVIFIYLINGGVWKVDFDGSNAYKIDSVDSVAPTDNSDLYQKLIALIA